MAGDLHCVCTYMGMCVCVCVRMPLSSLSATINTFFSSLNVEIWGVTQCICVCVCVCTRVCESVVTDVHPVAAGTALHIRHVLSDSDGQQVVLLIIQYILIFCPLPHTLSVSLSEAK